MCCSGRSTAGARGDHGYLEALVSRAEANKLYVLGEQLGAALQDQVRSLLLVQPPYEAYHRYLHPPPLPT